MHLTIGITGQEVEGSYPLVLWQKLKTTYSFIYYPGGFPLTDHPVQVAPVTLQHMLLSNIFLFNDVSLTIMKAPREQSSCLTWAWQVES